MSKLETVTDEELVSLYASSKDTVHFDELHRRYRGQLIAYLQRTHSVIGLSGAEDVVQQTFLSVATNYDQFDPQWKFSNWVFSIAANFAVNMRKATGRRPAASFEDFSDNARRAPVFDAYDPEDHREDAPTSKVMTDERNAHLRCLVGQLPDQYREIMERLYFQGMTNEEAATDLGIKLGTLKTRLHWSLCRLREQTGQDEELYRAA